MVRITHRLAFTMLELIFAIVIIAISVVSLPMMTQVTSSGIEKSLVQDAILIGSSEIVKMTAGQWDEKSRENNNSYNESIICVDNAEEFDGNLSRIGNVNISYLNDKTVRPSIGLDSGEDIDSTDDVDDNNISNYLLTDDGSVSGYKFKYYKTVRVETNTTLGTLTNSKNLKKITLMIKNFDNDEDLVELYTYVANTGSAEPTSRELP